MDREAWHAAVHGFAKSQTWLSNWTELILSYTLSHLWITYNLMQCKCYVNSSWGTANSTFALWNFLEFLFFKYFPSTVGWIHRCRTHRYRGPTGQHLCNRRVYSGSGKQFKIFVGIVSLSLCCHKKIPETGWPKQQKFITHILETRNSTIKVPANSVTGEDSFPDLQMATFLLCAHMVERYPFLYGH